MLPLCKLDRTRPKSGVLRVFDYFVFPGIKSGWCSCRDVGNQRAKWSGFGYVLSIPKCCSVWRIGYPWGRGGSLLAVKVEFILWRMFLVFPACFPFSVCLQVDLKVYELHYGEQLVRVCGNPKLHHSREDRLCKWHYDTERIFGNAMFQSCREYHLLASIERAPTRDTAHFEN